MTKWENYYDNMKDAVANTLETLTFAVVEPLKVDLNEDDNKFSQISAISCSIDNEDFLIILNTTNEFINMILENIYPNSDLNLNLITDTINEINNTICGNFLRSIQEFKDRFKLGLPESNNINWSSELIRYSFTIEDNYTLFISICK